MLMAALIIGVLGLCIVVVLYFLGVFGDVSLPLPKGLSLDPNPSKEPEESETEEKGTGDKAPSAKPRPGPRVDGPIVIQTLERLGKAQEEHHRRHGRYALSLGALKNLAGLDRTVVKASTPMSPYHGYYFVCMEMYDSRPVDPKTEFIITALPVKYGGATSLSYALDRSGIVRSKDLGGSLVRSASDIDSTWTPVR